MANYATRRQVHASSATDHFKRFRKERKYSHRRETLQWHIHSITRNSSQSKILLQLALDKLRLNLKASFVSCVRVVYRYLFPIFNHAKLGFFHSAEKYLISTNTARLFRCTQGIVLQLEIITPHFLVKIPYSSGRNGIRALALAVVFIGSGHLRAFRWRRLPTNE